MEKKPDKRKTNRNLIVPKDVDRYIATKIQIAIRIMDKVLVEEPHKFNSKAYLELLEQFSIYAVRITKARKNDKTAMAEIRDADAEAQLGESAPPWVGSGVPAENPATR
jgi:hypothetical protein